jgi:hypothetical protein
MKRTVTLTFLLLFLTVTLRAAPGPPPPLSTGPETAFMTGSIVVKGEGIAPDDKSLSDSLKRILSLRAAKVMALREAAEVLDGVVLHAEMTVLNAAKESDSVSTAVDGVIKGAEVVREVYEPLIETGTVYLRIPMAGPDGLMATIVPGAAALLSPASGPPYRPIASAVPGVLYDGLILDVRGYPFRPALINRVVTRDGRTLYDPSLLDRGVLARMAAPGYTNDLAKARALMGERGSSNPAIVRADSLAGPTDVVVRPADAEAIFRADQENNFLYGTGGAGIIFVLQ